MSVIFCGSTVSDVLTVAVDNATATYYDNLYQKSGLFGNMGTTTPITVNLPVAVTNDLWVHYRCYYGNNGFNVSFADGQQMSFYDVTGAEIARVEVQDGQSRCEAVGNTTVVGAWWAWGSANATYTFDIRLAVSGTNIVLDLYVNGVLVSTATASNTTALKGKPKLVKFDNNDFGGDDRYFGISEIIMTDNESTIGWRLASLVATSAGTYAAWLGDYTHTLDAYDGRFIQAAETGIRESWNLSAYAGPPTPASIRGVYSKIIGSKGATGPQTVTPFVRLGGLDYEKTPLSPVAGQFLMFEWSQNPATLLPWNTSAFAALEIGVRSAT